MENINSQNRNIFSDNIFDVENLDDLKALSNIHILEKSNSAIKFELGNDFWLYDFENDELMQFPDFVSLRDNLNSVKVFSLKDPEFQNRDYAESIALSIKDNGVIPALKDFSLEERNEFIKSKIDKKVSIPIGVDGLDLKDTHKRLSNRIDKHVRSKSKEFEATADLTNGMLKTFSVMFAFFKALKVKTSKEKIIDDIVSKLNSGTDQKQSIMRDKELLKEVPELESMISKYDKFFADLIIEKDPITVKMKLKENIDKILQDEELLNATEKASSSIKFLTYTNNNMEQFKSKIELIKENLPTKITDFLTNDDAKEEYLSKLQSFSNEEWADLVYFDMNLKPTEYSDRLNLFAANYIINGMLKDETYDEYDLSINKIVNNEEDLKFLQEDKVLNIVGLIAEKILKLNVSKDNKLKI